MVLAIWSSNEEEEEGQKIGGIKPSFAVMVIAKLMAKTWWWW